MPWHWTIIKYIQQHMHMTLFLFVLLCLYCRSSINNSLTFIKVVFPLVSYTYHTSAPEFDFPIYQWYKPERYGSLQWCHNEHDGISNHQCLDCLLNHLLRHRPKKSSKLRVTGLCAGNSLVTGEFPAKRASKTSSCKRSELKSSMTQNILVINDSY